MRCQLLPLLASACLLLLQPAGANDTSLNTNVTPPRQLSALEEMPIRMAAEHITLRMGRERSFVDVEFTFQNLSDDYIGCTAGFPDEDLLVRYKLAVPASEDQFGYLDTFGDVGQRVVDDLTALSRFEAWSRPGGSPASASTALDTRVLKIERIAWEPAALASLGAIEWRPASPLDANALMFCRAFDLQLGPRETRIIGHRYSTGTGSNVESQHLLNYTLGTGRTWAGTIGEAQIDVVLEGGLTAADLHFARGPDDYGAVTSPGPQAWEQVSATHLRTVWTDFEPSGEQGYIMLATHPVAHAVAE